MRARTLSIVTVVAAAAATVGAGPSTAAPSAPVESRQHFVQLGDSYSAGNGAGEYSDTTCYRSPLNYWRTSCRCSHFPKDFARW